MQGIGWCGNAHHGGRLWHWTRRSRERCDGVQTSLDRGFQDIPPRPLRINERQLEQQRRELEDAVANHVPIPPGSDAELAVSRNGERQLLGRGRSWLHVLDPLLSSDIYRINTLLRHGKSLGGAPNVVVDSAGYSSMQSFMDDVQAMFVDIGSDLSLSDPLTVYRGIGLQARGFVGDFDFWKLQAFVHGEGLPPSGVLKDPGVSFASPLEKTAELYTGAFIGADAEASTVTLELVVRRVLCVPGPEHRGTELFRLLQPHQRLKSARAQIVVPPGTSWKVVSARQAGPGGRSCLVLEQI